jgi:nitroreductase
MYSGHDIISYHQQTKHHTNRYARSMGYLDWATQPDPFRRYAGAPIFPLPLSRNLPDAAYDALYQPQTIPAQTLSPTALGVFFGNALGLSAWKEYGDNRWELRCNPSSGNLHPTEGYCIAGPEAGITQNAAVYHYGPRAHVFEMRAVLSAPAWQEMTVGLPPQVFFVGLSSIHWREAWKYGERAWRYCQHDAGHALAALSYSGAALGWRVLLLDGCGDARIRQGLGLPAATAEEGPEAETPDMLCAVVPGKHDSPVPGVLPALNRPPEVWLGTPNQLSESRVHWEIIEEVAAACEKPETQLPIYLQIPPTSDIASITSEPDARQIFQQRRSAVAMDGQTALNQERFYQMLQRCCPGTWPPWWTWPYEAEVHLVLFVHRVTGMDPGIYLLQRNPAHGYQLRSAFRGDFLWESPSKCPPDLPLFLLARGDVRRLAASLCCDQEIAGDGAFMAGMIARFESVVEMPWRYRRLFWETGMIGQVLYLEAEAAGIRGTGIGCFFDDPVHETLGIEDLSFQSLYHFTVGGPVDDPRLRTLPPYPVERYS